MRANLKNVEYGNRDITKMSRIGKITTKPIRIKKGITEDSATYFVVDTAKDNSGKKVYVCDFYYSENEPYFISESQVLSYESFI